MCIFCDIYRTNNNLIYEDSLVFSIYDNFPVSKGHVLIITKRHVEDYFLLTKEEKISIDKAIMYMKSFIDLNLKPDGYNIGINNGAVAGQTIPHLHVHLIPRYQGDVENPKGGVRGVIPNKQKY
jgi:diadenosine tetraphosphate (Ap4A) HIT family hydrolase